MKSSAYGTSFLVTFDSFLGERAPSLDERERPPRDSWPMLSASILSLGDRVSSLDALVEPPEMLIPFVAAVSSCNASGTAFANSSDVLVGIVASF